MATSFQSATSPPSMDEVPGQASAAESIRVVLADDHVPMRRSLRLLLDGEEDLEVVAEADDHASAARHVHGHRPQVLVLDLGLRDGSSIEAIRTLSERVPQTKIVVLTMEDNPIFAQRALTAGASGYVAKDLADSELPQAVRAAAMGEEWVSPRVAARLDALHRALTDNKLTQREVEVLRLIAFGHTSVEIARMLHLSPRTIETHRAHIHKKLGLKSRAELVRYSLRRGLIGA
jgi:two-component system response regulator NreC